MRIVILASGRGSNAEAILKKVANKELLNVEVVALISDNEQAKALQIAKEYGVNGIYLDAKRKGARIDEQALQDYICQIKELDVDLIVLAGFMRILPKEFISEFSSKIINLHPSLLPSFKGKDAIKQAYEYGVKLCGCTVHMVNEEVDGGKILAQSALEISETMSLETLEENIHKLEHILLPDTIMNIQIGKIKL